MSTFVVRNPKTGELRPVRERWDVESGENLARKNAIDKGWQPVQLITNPKTQKRKAVPDTSEKIQEAIDKGWLLPHQVAEQDKTYGRSGEISKGDVQKLADQYGVDFEQLDEIVEFVGGIPNYRDVQGARYVLGLAGRAHGGHIDKCIH